MPRFSEKLAFWLIPGILVLLFLSNLFLVGKYRLSPWKGGGMRMFSEVNVRLLGFYTSVNGSVYFVNLSSEFASAPVYTFPTDGNLKALQYKIESRNWCLSADSLSIVPCSAGKEHQTPLKKITVDSLEVYKVSLNVKNDVLTPHLIKTYRSEK